MSENFFFHNLQPLDPSDESASNRPFNECYRLIKELSYSNDLGTQNTPEKFGDREEKKCCFCGETNETKSFSKDAHVLPASLGNRIYFSHEECNDCNEKYGTKYENALADMIAPQRAIAGIRKRKGMPKLKVPNQSSFLKKDNLTNSLQLHINGLESSFSMNAIGENAFSLKVPTPPFNPIDAIKSLIHTMWLVLPQKLRQQNPWVVEWLSSDDLPKCPLSYYDAFSPGPGFCNTVFWIWEKNPEIGGIPQFVMHLQIGNTILIVPLDESLPNEEMVAILPSLSLTKYPPFEPRMSKVTIGRNAKVNPRERTFTMHYDSKVSIVGENDSEAISGQNCKLEEPPASDRAPALTNPMPLPCEFAVIDSQDHEVRISRTYAQYDLVGDGYQLKLAGGELAGEIVLKGKEGGAVNISHMLHLSSAPLFSAKLTLDFLSGFLNPKQLEIKPFWNGLQPLRLNVASANPTVGFQESVQSSLELITAIEFLNGKYGLKLKYPEEVNTPEVQTALLAYYGLTKGAVALPIYETIQQSPKSKVEELIAMIGNGQQSISGKNELNFTIWGNEIDVGNITIELTNASFEEDLHDLTNRIKDLGADEIVSFKLKCAGVVYFFENVLENLEPKV